MSERTPREKAAINFIWRSQGWATFGAKRFDISFEDMVKALSSFASEEVENRLEEESLASELFAAELLDM